MVIIINVRFYLIIYLVMKLLINLLYYCIMIEDIREVGSLYKYTSWEKKMKNLDILKLF